MKANFALGGFYFNETGLASQIRLGGGNFDVFGPNTVARYKCDWADIQCGGGDALTYALQALSCTTEGSNSMAHVCCWVGFCSLVEHGVPGLLLSRDIETASRGDNLGEVIRCYEAADTIFNENGDLEGVKQAWSCMTTVDLLIAQATLRNGGRAEAGYTWEMAERARKGSISSMVLDQHIFSQLVAFRDYSSHKQLLGLNAFDSSQPWTFMEAYTVRICITCWLSMSTQIQDPSNQQDIWFFIQQLKARGLNAIVNDLVRSPVPSHTQHDLRGLNYEGLVRVEKEAGSECLLYKRGERLFA